MLMQEFNKKFHATQVKRIATEHIWGSIRVNSIIELKYIKRKGMKNGGSKNETISIKYKVINKKHRNLLLENVNNKFLETFTFSDFLTGDVSI